MLGDPAISHMQNVGPSEVDLTTDCRIRGVRESIAAGAQRPSAKHPVVHIGDWPDLNAEDKPGHHGVQAANPLAER